MDNASRKDWVELIQKISRTLPAINRREEVFSGVLPALAATVDFDVAICLILDEEIKVYIETKESASENFIRRAFDDALSAIRDHMMPFFVPSQYSIESMKRDLRGKSFLSEDVYNHRFTALLYRGSNIVGSVNLYRGSSHPFTLDDEFLLSLVNMQISLAFEKIYAIEKVNEMVIRDDMTGIYNKRYLMDSLEKEFVRSQRYKEPFSLMLMDIDHFKKINDLYGHPQGDVVLSEFCGLVRENIRPTDVFARFGGDEFAIILPYTPAAEAYEIAERIRTIVQRTSFPSDSLPLSVTLSAGIVTSADVPCKDAIGFLKLADRALYDSKREGRNRTSVCSAAAEVRA